MSLNGTKPPSLVTERTSFAWPVVVAFIVAALAAGALQFQVADHGKRLDEHQGKLDKAAVDLQEVKDDVRYIRLWAERQAKEGPP